MAIHVPPSGRPPRIGAPQGASLGRRPRRGREAHGVQHEAHEHELHESDASLAGLAGKVRALNDKPPGEWTTDDYRELERLVELLLAQTEALSRKQDSANAHALAQAVEQTKLQLRMLLQTLQPPPELLDQFMGLWTRVRGAPNFDVSTFVRRTLMNARVRNDVMNQKMEESVDEADRLATERRVKAISRDDRGQGQPDTPPEDGEPDKRRSLKLTLRQLKKKRRTIGVAEAGDVAGKALETMRMLREQVVPRWAPETQPWLLQTADTHVFSTVLAVIPEELFRETAAYQGMQNLRAGEHAFAGRAASRIEQGAARTK